MMEEETYCKLTDLIEHLELKLITGKVDYNNIKIFTRDVNRSGLQLTGFSEYYDNKRIQIIGNAENAYLNSLGYKKRIQIYKKIIKLGAPCYVFCRNINPDDELIKIAEDKNIPILKTEKSTTTFMYSAIRYLNVKLSRTITLHGCLVDIYGIGVLIRGESGIGKSEALLELLKRGHRMIADDAVEISLDQNNKLCGSAPALIKEYLEIRGIGIVNVKNLFGIQAIKDMQTIDMIAILEEWNSQITYDRIGNNTNCSEILNHKVWSYRIPVRHGRNTAVILEAAALNCRNRIMGHNDVDIFFERYDLH